MKYRAYCFYCEQQLNDKEDLVQHSATGITAHRRCAELRPNQKFSDKPMPALPQQNASTKEAQPMTKEEAEKFLTEYPQPWREEYDCDRSRTFYISCKGNPEFQLDLEKLLRYIAYLEQQNEAMQGLIDIMGDDK